MAGKDNLISLGERSPEERSEIARMGGIASGEARRRSRLLKDRILDIVMLDAQFNEERNVWKDMLGDLGADEPDHKKWYSLPDSYKPKQVLDVIAMQIVTNAMNGGTRAVQMVVDALGTNRENE